MSNQKNPQLKVILILGEVVKTAAGFKIPVSALVTKGEKAIKGLMVQFYLGVQQSGAAVRTDDNGRVPYEFEGISLNAKEVMLQVQVEGTSTWDRKVVNLPSEPKAPSKALTCSEPEVFGDNGIYTIQVRVADEKHQGVQGIKFVFRDQYNTGNVAEAVSDANGYCSASIGFREIEKFVVIDYPDGTSKRIHLFGPIPSRSASVNTLSLRRTS